METRSIHFKSDFLVRLVNEVDWSTPFSIRFFTTRAVSAKVVAFDGENYVGCTLDESTGALLVPFERFTELYRQGLGTLRMELTYRLSNALYPDQYQDVVLPAQPVVCTNDQQEEFYLSLALTGDDDVEVSASVVAPFMVGPQGAAGTGISTMTQTSASVASAGANVWKMTLTDGREFSFTVLNGEKGDTGAQGPQGPQGAKGAKGDKGDKGDTGARGPQGEQGPRGIPGPRGEKGAKGDTGARGLKGETGPAGNTPEIGQNGNWWIGGIDTGVKADYSGTEAQRQATFEANEADRNEEFASKEATRDAANQAALNCAETLAALGPEIGSVKDWMKGSPDVQTLTLPTQYLGSVKRTTSNKTNYYWNCDGQDTSKTYSVFIPLNDTDGAILKEGDKVVVSASSNVGKLRDVHADATIDVVTMYGFLAKMPVTSTSSGIQRVTVSGGTETYESCSLDGSSPNIVNEADAVVTLTIPANAKWLFLLKSNASATSGGSAQSAIASVVASIYPAATATVDESIERHTDPIEETLGGVKNDVEAISVFDNTLNGYGSFIRYTGAIISGKWRGGNSNYRLCHYMLIPVGKNPKAVASVGDTIRLTPREGIYAYYVFLPQTPVPSGSAWNAAATEETSPVADSVDVVFLGEDTNRHTSVNVVEMVVPQQAYYLYVLTRSQTSGTAEAYEYRTPQKIEVIRKSDLIINAQNVMPYGDVERLMKDLASTPHESDAATDAAKYLGFVFAQITDTHGFGQEVIASSATRPIKRKTKMGVFNSYDTFRRFVEFVGYCRKTGLLADAVHTGDMVSNVFGHSIDYMDESGEGYDGAATAPYMYSNGSNEANAADGSDKVLRVIGNHDIYVTSGDAPTAADVYDKFISSVVENWGVTQPSDAASSGKCYYYKDYTNTGKPDGTNTETYNLRAIFINCEQFDATQKAWVEGLFDDVLTKSGNWAVVIFSHELPAKMVSFGSYRGGTSATYKSTTLYSTESNIAVGGDYKQNFEDLCVSIREFQTSGGTFVGIVSGHLHSGPYVGMLENIEGVTYHDRNGNAVDGFNVLNQQYPIIGFVGGFGNVTLYHGSPTTYTRERDTIYQDNFQMLSIDMKSKVVKLRHIGGTGFDLFGKRCDFATVSYAPIAEFDSQDTTININSIVSHNGKLYRVYDPYIVDGSMVDWDMSVKIPASRMLTD